MMRHGEVVLYVYMDKLWAVSSALKAQDSSVEKQLLKKFDELYEELVPQDVRQEIDSRMDAEYAAAQAEWEASRVFSVFRVKEHNGEEYFQVEQKLDLLDAAKLLRRYLRQEPGANKASFVELFPKRETVSAERFDQMVGLRMENSGKVAEVLDLDFDKREFSVAHIADGWRSYAMSDVSTAVYHAFRKEGSSQEQRWDRLLEKLDGKEIASAGHLSAREISLAEEICEMDGHRLNFYLETNFDVDAVFGTHVCTAENDDTLNVYANYDMTTGQICDTLEVDLYWTHERDEYLDYQLNAAEKAVLLRKMEDYCQQQTGQSLAEYSAQCLSEDLSPSAGPVL